MAIIQVTTNKPFFLYELCGDQPNVSPVPPEETDALMRSVLVWVDHYGAGYAQSLGTTDVSSAHYGRYYLRSNDDHFIYSPIGGRFNGGYVEAAIDGAQLFTNVLRFDDEILSGDVVFDPSYQLRQKGNIVYLDLMGQEPSDTNPILKIGAIGVFILADLTLEVRQFADPVWVPLVGGTSNVTVPANGAFGLELQVGAAPTGYRVGGFALLRLYLSSLPSTGTLVTRVIGSASTPVPDGSIDGSVITLPLGARIYGLGEILPIGDKRKWMYDMVMGAALPISDGETQSVIGWNHAEEFGLDIDYNPYTIVSSLTWGELERWKNVISKTHSASSDVEPLYWQPYIGWKSPATTRWISTFAGFPQDPPTIPTSDDSIRNTIHGEGSDYYNVGLNLDVTPTEIIALGPFILSGARFIQGVYSNDFALASRLFLPWMFAGPKPAVTMNWQDPIGAPHHAFDLMLKDSSGILYTGRRGWPSLPGQGVVNHWLGMRLYQLNPPTLFHTKSDGSKWNPDDLPQTGVKTTFEKLDAIEGLDPNDRWLHLDIGQIGLDVAFRYRPVPEQIETLLNPLADLRIFSHNESIGNIFVWDGSIDFNRSVDELVSAVVSRVIDWGDGSPTEEFAGGGTANKLEHTYSQQGTTYTLKVTITNADGLTAISTIEFTPLAVVTPDFSQVLDEDDETQLTVDFTDLSTITMGSIVSRHWNFGDGNTSNATNPSHTYEDYDTYTVTLTVTDDIGRTFSIDTDVEVTEPVVGGGGCGLTVVGATAVAGNQADDYAGGNPRFPNYGSSTVLRDWVWDQTTFRGFYNGSLAHDSSQHILDTVETFNGRPSHRVEIYGDGYGGWNAQFSDDTGPGDDSDYSHNEVTSVWVRIIFKLNAQAISIPASGTGNGLQIATLYGRNNYNPLIWANGHLYHDIQTRLTLDGAETRREIVDLGAITDISNGEWMEMILWAGIPSSNTQQNMAWLGLACELSGVSPLSNRSNTAFGTTGHPAIDFRDLDLAYYTNGGSTLFSDPKPAVIYSLIEIRHLNSFADNPFGVSLT